MNALFAPPVSRNRMHKLTISLIFAWVVALPVGAAVNLAQAPLFTTASVKPNLMFIVDNSGSMDSELLIPTNDGALWWHTGDQSFVGRDADDVLSLGAINFNRAGGASATWKKYMYLFPNGQGVPNRVYGDGTNDHYAIPPISPYAWLRSADYNGMYYDSAIEFEPWVPFVGQNFVDINPQAAISDAHLNGNSLNLTSDIADSDANRVFKMWPGMVIPAGTYFQNSDGTWETAASDILLDVERNVPIRYYPATFFSKVETGSYSTANFLGSCADPQPGHYLDFAAAPGDFTGVGVDALGPDGGCLVRYEIKAGNAFPSDRSYEDEMQNFANWFSYYRKRHLALRGGAASALDSLSGFRIGGFPINNLALQGMWDFDTQRDNFLGWLYDRGGNSAGTPNREALNYAGGQFSSNGVITHSCQHNFALLFTDGFSNPWTGAGVGNADGDKGSPFTDEHSNTMADIAMDYYSDILRADINEGNVPVVQACEAANPPLQLDCNKNLHMVTFGITLGAQGHLFGVTHNSVEDAHLDPPAWANPTLTRNPVQVDDLYHAAVNSRGEMLNARSAQELADALKTAMKMILDVPRSSSSSVAANSTRLDTGTLVYQARFDDDDWSGELLSFPVNFDDGTLEESPSWDASEKIPASGLRNIFTISSDTNAGVAFLWDELGSQQKFALNKDPAGIADTLGPNRLAWLRGDATDEAPNGNGFRARSRTVLGDIVNSDPVFVGDQSFGNNLLPGMEGSSYVNFRVAMANRPKMVYVGANDGMLHGFDAVTGAERLAFVPKAVYASLSKLTDPDYIHQYFVDGSPRAADAYIDHDNDLTKSWRTVLMGTTGAGARSVFALDITDPGNFVAGDVLWELNSDDNPELGFTLGEATIARVAAGGKWVALVGNGYNSQSHTARLFVIDLENGAVLKDLNTGIGSAGSPNGLNAPVPVDVNGDRIADFVYAGDLQGNVWRFDLSGTIDDWGIADFGESAQPLFTAMDSNGVAQPITVRPTVGAHPDGGLMVYFGTGKFFESGDELVPADPQIQAFYGVWDKGVAITNRDLLQEQTIVAQGTQNFTQPDNTVIGYELRLVSQTQVDYTTKYGWFMDLVYPNPGTGDGERVASRAILRNDRIIFTSMIPGPNPCEFGGDGWLMELDALSGGRLGEPVFDLDGDGDFDGYDGATNLGIPALSGLPSGFKSKEGIINTPGIIEAGEKEYKFASGSSGNIERVVESGADAAGRKGWWQLR